MNAPARPWPVVLLTALGAWLAAVPLIGVVHVSADPVPAAPELPSADTPAVPATRGRTRGAPKRPAKPKVAAPKAPEPTQEELPESVAGAEDSETPAVPRRRPRPRARRKAE